MENPIGHITKDMINHIIHDISSLSFFRQERIRTSGLIYEEIRLIIIDYLENTFRKLVPLKQSEKNSYVTEKDVLRILHFVPGMVPDLKHCSKHSVIKLKKGIKGEYKDVKKQVSALNKKQQELLKLYRQNQDDADLVDKINELDEKIEPLREKQDDIYDNQIEPLREKREELSEKIKNQDSCLYFYSRTFRKIINYFARDFLFTFTDDAYLLLQYDTEYYLCRLIENGIRGVYHAKRETIMPRDLQLARRSMVEYEKVIPRPRFVYPQIDASYEKEYTRLRDAMGIENKNVNKNLVSQLDRFNTLLIDLLMQYAHVFNQLDKKQTITKRSLILAVDSVIPGELGKHAQSEGRKTEEQIRKNIFDVQVNHALEKDASVYLNTVIEYINAEIIGLIDGLESTKYFYSILEDDEELNMLAKQLGFVPIKIT
jgi:histone H3/H4